MSPRACRATAFRDAFSFCFLVAAYRCSGVGALPVCVCVCGHARLAVRRKPIELSEKYIGMSGATIFAELMKEHEVDHIFGYPGGAILPVFDAIHDAETFKFILTRTCLVRAPGCPLCRSPAERCAACRARRSRAGGGSRRPGLRARDGQAWHCSRHQRSWCVCWNGSLLCHSRRLTILRMRVVQVLPTRSHQCKTH